MAQVKEYYASAKIYADVLINYRWALDIVEGEQDSVEVNKEFEEVVNVLFKDQPRGREFTDFLAAVLDVLKEEQAKGEHRLLKWDELLTAFNNFMKKESQR